MEPKSILHIVSGFKPSVDGMGDFSRLLGAALWKQYSIQSHFLVYRRPGSPSNPEEILPNTLSFLPEPDPQALRSHIADLQSRHKFDCVLLHFGPYAYSSDGKPTAFTRVIEEFAPSNRLLVFFHEIYASGKPWRRAFWTRSEQRRCVDALLQVADVAITSNHLYWLRLQALNSASREIFEIPIFSNTGEPENLRPLHQRTRQLVVFGQLVTRLRLYRNYGSALEELCRKLRIEKIADVGSGQSPHIPETIAGIPVIRAGFMEERQLSDLLADSIAGIIAYHPDIWQKSGVIAAYQAHALVPIMAEQHKRSISELDFLPYISLEKIVQLASSKDTIPDARIQAIADAAHDAYTHNQSIDHCARVIARCAFPDGFVDSEKTAT